MSVEDDLIQRGNRLHDNRGSLLNYWQEVGDHFYPERADFTVTRHLGKDFADGLYTSYPLIVRRELGNSVAAFLRPKTKIWAHMTVEEGEDTLSHAAKMWLADKTKIQRKAMYDRSSGFVRATKEGDHDFMTFGQCVIQREMDWNRPGLSYRTWHLRDCAWQEDHTGRVNELHRNWNPTVCELMEKFGGRNGNSVHPEVAKLYEKEPFRTVKCRALFMPADTYKDEKTFRQPWMHAYIDLENKHIMEQVGLWSHGYTVPRWQTVSGSQYAYSPATVAGLPDARLIQSVTLTLLEAGEMAVRPPMIATQDAIRQDIQLYAGGITWADIEYDERKGDVLRPISQNASALPFGLDVQEDIRNMLATAFYLNKINLPIRQKDQTAYEVSKMYEQYIRDVVPLFEPMETDYNGALCEDTFEAMLRVGMLGPYEDIPQELRGRDIQFRFESPLHDAIEEQKGEKLREAIQLAAETAELDQNAPIVLDAVTALREALEGKGTPESWLRDKQAFAKIVKDRQEMQQAQQALEMAQQGADIQQTVNS